MKTPLICETRFSQTFRVEKTFKSHCDVQRFSFARGIYLFIFAAAACVDFFFTLREEILK